MKNRDKNKGNPDPEQIAEQMTLQKIWLELVSAIGKVGLWIWNIDSGRLSANTTWWTMLGYSPGDIEDTHSAWEGLIHPDDLEQFKTDSNACVEGQSDSFQSQFRMRSGDGSWHWENLVGLKTGSDKDGSPIEISGIIQNIDVALAMADQARAISEYSGRVRFMLHYMISKGIDIASIVDSPLFGFGASRDEYDLLLAVIKCGQHWDNETCTGTFFVKDSSFKYVYVSQGMSDLLDVPIVELLGRTDEELFGSQPQSDETLMTRFREKMKISSRQIRIVEGRSVPFSDELTYFKFGILAGGDSDDDDDNYSEEQEVGAIIYLLGFPQMLPRSETDLESEFPSEPQYISKAMRKTLELAYKAAQSDSTILLAGERGSGKDYMAQYIHNHSKRAAGPFFPINLATISPQLVETELFGCEPGAYTGAPKLRKKGLLEMAEGGTLFLNEIGELQSTSQAKLLSFLENCSLTRVGGTKTVEVDVRLIAATNRQLEIEIKEERFRPDLFDRLNVIKITVPPLRERKDDIPVLVKKFLKEFKSKGLTQYEHIDFETLRVLKMYNWGGNVRELKTRLERALVIEPGQKLTARSIFSDLGENIEEELLRLGVHGRTEDAKPWTWDTEFPENLSYNQCVKDLKESLISEALQRSDGNKKQAARLLGMSIDALQKQIKTLSKKRVQGTE